MIKLNRKKFQIKTFTDKNINKKFLNSLNNKNLNKFLSTNKKKQKFEDALNYLNYMNKNKHIYLGVFNRSVKQDLIGTITFRTNKINNYYLGYMVCDERYLGKDIFFNSLLIIIKYLFKKKNLKKISAGIDKKNLSSGFFLLKLGFKIISKTKKTIKFEKVKN